MGYMTTMGPGTLGGGVMMGYTFVGVCIRKADGLPYRRCCCCGCSCKFMLPTVSSFERIATLPSHTPTSPAHPLLRLPFKLSPATR